MFINLLNERSFNHLGANPWLFVFAWWISILNIIFCDDVSSVMQSWFTYVLNVRIFVIDWRNRLQIWYGGYYESWNKSS